MISFVVTMRLKVTAEWPDVPDPDPCQLAPGPGPLRLAFLVRPPASQAGEGLLINSLPSESDATAAPSAGLRKSSHQTSKMQLDLQVSSEI